MHEPQLLIRDGVQACIYSRIYIHTQMHTCMQACSEAQAKEENFGKEICMNLSYLAESESIKKIANTFLNPLPDMADAETGRIHTSLNINTETGRLSSQRPNLQNQPALEKDVYGVSVFLCVCACVCSDTCREGCRRSVLNCRINPRVRRMCMG